MSKQGIALVGMLDGIMAGSDSTIANKLDATEVEMKEHCDKYPCVDCPILCRCSLGYRLFNTSRGQL